MRGLLHAAGLRYRVDARLLPDLNRRAEILFTRARVAVFVDGCFWHGTPDHDTFSRSNATYWAERVMPNRERDGETDRLLTAAGWTVIRA